MLRVPALPALVALAVVPLTVLLCRFTVRDVGFVDLGDPAYRLYAFVSKAESPAAHEGIGRLATALFAETNVEVERVDPDSEEEHDAHRLLSDLKLQDFPTNVLVHPDGRAIEVPFGGSFEEAGGRALESVFHSPLRRRIVDEVLQRYCSVLIVEGTDAAENQRVGKVVKDAIADIVRVFDKMPKAVGDVPAPLVLSAEDRADEKILLWSLGVDADASAEPSLAVLFGRGRRFGPVLDGAGITRATVRGVLANAGQSCECELDRSWMRGPRVPLRWDADIKQRAVKLLGFDPENPLVKSEISGILARGPKGKGERSGEPTIADLLGSYSEETIGGEEGEAARPPSSPSTKPLVSRQPTQEPPDDAGGLAALWWTFGGLLGFSLLAAGVIVMRARQGRP